MLVTKTSTSDPCLEAFTVPQYIVSSVAAYSLSIVLLLAPALYLILLTLFSNQFIPRNQKTPFFQGKTVFLLFLKIIQKPSKTSHINGFITQPFLVIFYYLMLFYAICTHF